MLTIQREHLRDLRTAVIIVRDQTALLADKGAKGRQVGLE
jgi:hypothetical protein